MTTKILILEDDQPIRQRLLRVLAAAPEFSPRGAASLAEARRLLATWWPDLLIVDLQLPDGNGIDLIRESCARPAVKVLVISVLADEQTVVAAIEAGAAGYLLKDAVPADIVETVRDVQRGHSPLSPRVARFILSRLQQRSGSEAQPVPPLPTLQASLTPRELDVLWGIAKGLKYAEIATDLGISDQTVPSHVKSIYRKLQVGSRSEAIYEACQQRLIRL